MQLRPLTALIIAFVVLIAAPAPADNAHYGEFQVKAAFIYNFCKFVEWPAEAFTSNKAPIVITIMCNHGSQDAFDTIRGKSVQGRLLELRMVKRPEEIGATQVLYVCDSEHEHHGHIPEHCRNQNMLTIDDLDPSGQCGGAIISFVMVDKKLRFQINLRAARKTGVKISSQLLKLARNVVE